MFDSMSLQLARNITEIKKTFHSTRRKKKCRVNYNQNKYSNIIKFGTKYKLFFPLYQITLFLAFGQAKKIFSYHILMNILIYILFCDKKLLKSLVTTTIGSSRPEVFCKKGVLGNFTKFTGKHLWQSLFFATLLKKRVWHRCFPVNFVKFLRTPFYKEHLWWLLL